MRSAKADSAAARDVSDGNQTRWSIVHDRERRLHTRIAQASL